MDSRRVKQLLTTAATGSMLILASAPLLAGRMFPDEPQRPHIHAGQVPNWGFNQTCWQRFPPVPGCAGVEGSFNPQPEYGQPHGMPYGSGDSIYIPQQGLGVPGPQSMEFQGGQMQSPGSANAQPYAPMSIPPYGSGPANPLVMPPSPVLPVQVQPPSGSIPTTPESLSPVRSFQSVPAPLALPPLPSPPASGAGVSPQSRYHQQRPVGPFASSRLPLITSQTQAIRSSSSGRYGQEIPSRPDSMTSAVSVSQDMQSYGSATQYVQPAIAGTQGPGGGRYGQRSAAVTSQAVPASRPPVRAVSQSRVKGSNSGSRYSGSISPISAQTEAVDIDRPNLEPLRTTPDTAPRR